MSRHAALLLLVAASAAAAEPTTAVKLDGHTFTLPAGFTVDRVAGPPLVDRPITADFDEKGRLYVADSSGSNDKVTEQVKNPTHRVVRLEDTDGDGVFDKAVVFADKLMFPEGTMWFDGSLFVACPPQILKLTDTDGDGKADKREVWFDGKTLTGCANDLHGPYRGPDGYIYWTKGAFAEQTYTLPNGKPFTTRASHIFRAKADGTGVEPVMTGGMDNPVDVVFTPGGERIFTTTFFQHPAGGKRDGLIHAVYGGVYGKDHDPVYHHPWTAPALMPPLTHLGAAAPSGLHRYDHTALGDGYRDSLFAALFNMAKVTRHVLVPDGATFRTVDSDFLASDNRDFHPTDVLEAPDGSLLVVDTGGWYKLCCPTSQLAKTDVLGAIYRVRRVGAKPTPRPAARPLPKLYEVALRRDRSGLADAVKALGDPDRHVRRLAAEAVGRIGDPSAVLALFAALADPGNDRVLDHSLTYALIEIADPAATAAGLSHPSPRVRRAAMTALDQMPNGGLSADAVLAELTAADPALRETAWWVAGRHPEWGAKLTAAFRARIAAVKTPAEADELTATLARFARSEAVQALLADTVADAAARPAAARLALRAMAAAAVKPPPAGWYAALARLLAGPPELAADAVAAVKALPPQKGDAAGLGKALAALGRNESAPAAVRFAALAAVPGGPTPVEPPLFAELMTAVHRDRPFAERSAAADALARSALTDSQLTALAAALKTAAPTELDRLLAPFARSTEPAVGAALLAALTDSPVRSSLRVDMLAPRLAKYPPAVRDRAETLYAALNADRAKQQARLDRLLKELPAGEIRRGQLVFNSTRAACTACHAMGYLGGKVGPDLTRIGGVRSERDLLEAIVYPSASFVRSYEPLTVTTADGRTYNGIVVKDAPDELVLRVTATDEVRVPRADVDEARPGSVSVMPAGLDQQLTPQELADLLAFLKAAK